MPSSEIEANALKPRDLAIIIGLNTTAFFNSTAYSVIAPFFPIHAKSLGFIAIGSVFAAFSLCSLVSSIYFGDKVVNFGPWKVFLVGTFGECVSGGLFGVSTTLTEYLILRSLQGIFCGMSVTSMFVLMGKLYPERLGVLNGILEMTAGAGYVAGPPLGGVLYVLGGFSTPLLVTNGATLVFLCIYIFFIPKSGDLWSGVESSPHQQKLVKLLLVPSIAVTAGAVLISMCIFTSYDTILSLHLLAFGDFNTLGVSIAFLVIATSYSLLSIGIGRITDKLHAHKWFIAVGLLICSAGSVGMTLYGGIVHMQPWLLFLILVVLASGLAAGTIPQLPDLIQSAMRHLSTSSESKQSGHGGEVDGIDVAGPMSGIYATFMSLGSVLGPIISAATSSAYSTNAAFFVHACITGIYGLVTLGFTIFEPKKALMSKKYGTMNV